MSWQRRVGARLRALAEIMAREYDLVHVPWTQYSGIAYIGPNGERIIRAPVVRGYVSFALYCHEAYHHVLGHLSPLARKPEAKQEIEAWGATKKTFQDNNIPWTDSVNAFMRATLKRMIREDLARDERKEAIRLMRAAGL